LKERERKREGGSERGKYGRRKLERGRETELGSGRKREHG
jgi:hypothetical protein